MQTRTSASLKPSHPLTSSKILGPAPAHIPTWSVASRELAEVQKVERCSLFNSGFEGSTCGSSLWTSENGSQTADHGFYQVSTGALMAAEQEKRRNINVYREGSGPGSTFPTFLPSLIFSSSSTKLLPDSLDGTSSLQTVMCS